ncbi:MAG: tetrahydrofolate dehydrogenase/cyclohydrolase catalytic domain-containing protein [Candidatus Thermoplasmatota archaeon]
MTARIIDGKAMAQAIRQTIAKEALRLPQRPGLAVVLLGDDPASEAYVRGKEKAAAEAGFKSVLDRRDSGITQEELLAIVRQHNEDPSIHGYLVQLPLPAHIDTDAIVEAIDPKKDVDGFHPINQGLLMRGTPRFIPATPKGVIEMLVRSDNPPAGKRVVILGRSTIVGRPLAAALLLKGNGGDATVTIAHSRTRDLPAVCREADILVAAIGQPRFVKKEWVKPGACVIDVGINRVDGKLCGDVDFDGVKSVAGSISPVPGGVGPMTIAMLLQNTLDAARAAP